MAINETLLVPDFRDKLHLLLAACQEQGVEMRPYFVWMSLSGNLKRRGEICSDQQYWK